MVIKNGFIKIGISLLVVGLASASVISISNADSVEKEKDSPWVLLNRTDTVDGDTDTTTVEYLHMGL